MPIKEKKCTFCKKKKPSSDFAKNRYKSCGLRDECKDCTRNLLIKKKYNISIEDYDKLYELQNGQCAICGKSENNGKRLAIDHNHKTGVVRGLLCTNCNFGIGNLKEDITLLAKAIEYLLK